MRLKSIVSLIEIDHHDGLIAHVSFWAEQLFFSVQTMSLSIVESSRSKAYDIGGRELGRARSWHSRRRAPLIDMDSFEAGIQWSHPILHQELFPTDYENFHL